MTLDQLPDNARVWIFAFEDPLSDPQQTALEKQLSDFVSNWKAHGAPVHGGAQIIEDRFLIVAADKDLTQVSGCSIDSLFRAVQTAAETSAARLAGPQTVFFRQAGELRTAAREKFAELCTAGQVDLSTAVFDLTLTELAQLRRSGLEKSMADSWHARAFF